MKQGHQSGFCLLRLPLLLLFILTASWLNATEIIPEIKRLSVKDIYFRQLYYDIQASYKAQQQNNPPPVMHLFRYKVKAHEDFYKLAAAFSIPQQTLATLNGLGNPSELKTGTMITLPNRQGLFLPADNKGSRFSLFIKLARAEQLEQAPTLMISGRKWYFLEGERFTPVEQAFFLKILYRFPLNDGVLTSSYGSRPHPFTNRPSWHKGIDLAAPEGTDVFAANAGTVAETGNNKIYGNYVLLKHENGYETFYAHLSRIHCTSGTRIDAGLRIGAVGSTGQSTGPHLHFEIRKEGQALDPDHFLLQ